MSTHYLSGLYNIYGNPANGIAGKCNSWEKLKIDSCETPTANPGFGSSASHSRFLASRACKMEEWHKFDSVSPRRMLYITVRAQKTVLCELDSDTGTNKTCTTKKRVAPEKVCYMTEMVQSSQNTHFCAEDTSLGESVGTNSLAYESDGNADCYTLPGSMQGSSHPRGCPGAVWSNGSPSKKYCSGDDYKYPWWGHCCRWKNGECVPKQKPEGLSAQCTMQGGELTTTSTGRWWSGTACCFAPDGIPEHIEWLHAAYHGNMVQGDGANWAMYSGMLM